MVEIHTHVVKINSRDYCVCVVQFSNSANRVSGGMRKNNKVKRNNEQESNQLFCLD